MRQTIRPLPAVTFAAALLAACATLPAHAETRTFDLDGFKDVAASAGVNVILKQGPYAISVSEPDGQFDKLVLEVRGSELRIGRKNNTFGWGSRGPRFTVTVTAPEYRAISASSGSDVDGENLRFADLSVDVSSGADVQLSGSCKALSVDVSSGSDFSGKDLRCETATVDASSGADADVFATASASGDASSGADITFHGKPATFTKDTSSGGSVKSL